MENKTITLKEDGGLDVLVFSNIGGEEISINLNSKDQSNLRLLFYKIIEEELENPFKFKLVVEEQYKKNLYIEIAEEYVKQLNGELSKIIEDVPQDFKSE